MKTLAGVVLVLLLVGLVPFGLIALSRSRPSPASPVRLIQNMDHQPKFKAQRENAMFADGRAMRPLAVGVLARQDLLVPNELLDDPAFPHPIDGRLEPYAPSDAAGFRRLLEGTREPPPGAKPQAAGTSPPAAGKAPQPSDKKPSAAGDQALFIDRIPVPVTMDLLRRGQERFNVYCAPCHGLSGYGDGMVARRAAAMQATGADTASGWVAPTNYHTRDIRERPVGHLYNTVANGIRSMPSYAKQISVLDRWAIVAYVKALQRSQAAGAGDVPENERNKFQP